MRRQAMMAISLASTAAAQSDQARWGQAWTTLADPALLVYGGMVPGNGQTYTSAPATNDLLYLPLTSNFAGSSPPWQVLDSSQGPATSWSSMAALSGASSLESVLLFGGESPSVPVQTGNDSAWAVGLSSTAGEFAEDSTAQPMRRMRHTLSSAYSPTSSLAWLFGGLKADGSGTPFAELWQYSATPSTPASGTWSACSPGAQAVYDHAAVTTTSGDAVQLWVVGGAAPGPGGGAGMADMGVLQRFTPDLGSTTCSGAWDNVTISGSAPSPRRGHAMVALSTTQMLLFGGASQSGDEVYSDLWTLDVSKRTWTELSPSGAGPSARWGHAMARVGSSVVVALGYGAASAGPADTDVYVYNVASGAWGTSFAPANSATASSTAASASATRTNRASTAAAATSTSTAVSQTGASQPDDSPDTEAAPTPTGWQTPGSTDPAAAPLASASSTNKSSSPSPAVIGVTVGLFGLIALAGCGAYYFYRRRQQREEWRDQAAAYRRRAYGGGASLMAFGKQDVEDVDGDKEVLFAPADDEPPLHAIGARSPPQNAPRGPRGHGGHALGLGAAVGAGMGALWAGRHQRRQASGGRRQRFDMLADEESDVWDPDAEPGDDEMEELRSRRNTWMVQNVGGKAQVSARDGPQIWDGLEEASPRLGHGTATSFLGASLAPWSDDGGHSRGVSELGSVDDYRDPFSTVSTDRTDRPKGRPIPNWSSPPASPRVVKTASADSHSSSSGRPPATTAPSSVASCHATAGLDVLSPALSGASDGLKRSSTWWDRIRSQGGVASPGASMPIRDPAPAPSLAVIPEASVLAPRHDDPFSDAAAARAATPDFDEHGRSFDGSHFQSSSQGSNQTATSSMIDRATRDMMVVQRMRTGSGIDDPTTPMMTPSTMHADDTPRASEAGRDWGVAVSEQPTPALSGIASPQGDLVWNGPSMWMSPMPPEAALSPSFSLASPPPLALTAVDLGRSARRPLPVPTRKQTAGTTGVKAMVQQFEAVSAESTFSPPLAASTATTPEKSIRSVAGSVTSSGHGSSAGDGQKKGGQQKVEHGLVKKPLLFVANPDDA